MPSPVAALFAIASAVSSGPDSANSPPPAAGLPAAWEGVWRGDAIATAPGPGAKPMTFTMELRVAPKPAEAGAAQRWSWTIIYDGAQGRQERPYTLVAKDPAKGLYEIDEHNSIVLPATLVGDALVSPFDVGGNLLVTSYTLTRDPETINFRIFVVASEKPAVTGGKEGVPEVRGYPVSSGQWATLRRVNPEPASK